MYNVIRSKPYRLFAFALAVCLLLSAAPLLSPAAAAEGGNGEAAEDKDARDGGERGGSMLPPVITVQPEDYTASWQFALADVKWDWKAISNYVWEYRDYLFEVASEKMGKASFRVEAEGEELQYQWQVSTDGVNWEDLDVYYAHSPELMVAVPGNGRRYRCVVSNAAGSAVSEAALLIAMPGGIRAWGEYWHPSTVDIMGYFETWYAHYGETVTLRCPVFGIGLSYQWYKNGAPATEPGADARFLTVTATEYKAQYVCEVTDNTGFGLQDSYTGATITVYVPEQPEPQIISQPQDAVGKIGQKVTFSIQTAADGNNYQWEYSDDGGVNWKKTRAVGANTASISVTPTCAGYNGRMYRCWVWSISWSGMVCSAPAVLHVPDPAPPVITEQPHREMHGNEYIVDVSMGASGEDLHYQWQGTVDGGISWKRIGGSKDLPAVSFSGQYGATIRCIVSNAGGTAISDYVYISTKEDPTPIDQHEDLRLPSVTQQPADVYGTLLGQAVFQVKAEGDELIYRWQYSDDSGRSWKDTACPGYDTDTLRVTIAGYGYQGRRYRCLIWNQRGAVSSETAVLTFSTDIYQPLTIVRQPEIRKVTVPSPNPYKLSENVVFSVEAQGGTNLTYQWQYSDDRGYTWTNSSCTAPKLTVKVNASETLLGGPRLYRCMITDRDRKDSGKTVYSKTVFIWSDFPLIYIRNDNSGSTETVSLAVGDYFAIQWGGFTRGYWEHEWYQPFYEEYDTFVEYSDDGGATWTREPFYANLGFDRGGVGEDGSFYLLIDSLQYDGRIYRMAWVYRGTTHYSRSYLLSVSPPD